MEIKPFEKPEEFGVHIKEKRKEAKLTLRQLEKLSGVSKAYLSQIETGCRGIPSPQTLSKICPHLPVSYEELMFLAGYLPENSLQINNVTIKYSNHPKISEFIKVLESSKLSDDQLDFVIEQAYRTIKFLKK